MQDSSRVIGQHLGYVTSHPAAVIALHRSAVLVPAVLLMGGECCCYQLVLVLVLVVVVAAAGREDVRVSRERESVPEETRPRATTS